MNEEGGYWSSEDGILVRLEMLGNAVVYGSFNGAIRISANAFGITKLMMAGPEPVCPYCQQYYGEIYQVNWFMPEFPAHPNCFLPEVPVMTDRGLRQIGSVRIGDRVLTHRGRFRPVTYIHKNMFEGKLYRFGDVYATGEHPFLTEDGWVRADRVDDVADILCSEINNDRQSSMRVETDKCPIMASKKNFLPSVMAQFSSGIMPVSPVDLDGDSPFGDGEVDVVDVDGILGNNGYPLVDEDGEEPLFKLRKRGSGLNGEGVFDFLPMGPLHMAGMGGVELPEPLLGCHSTPFVPAKLTWCKRCSGFYKAGRYHALRNIVSLGDLPLEHSALVEFNDILGRQFGSLEDPLSISLPHNPSIRTITNNTDKYKGLVYNLEVEEDHTFTVGKDRLISHNCTHLWDVYIE